MHTWGLTPLLSELDLNESSEGGLDPLGTEPLADKLAAKLAPGVRERQQHPRFLTATAASLSLTADWGEEVLARDGVTEPWLVFEWHLVHGLVLASGRQDLDLRGLPGRLKAEQALRDGVPLSPRRYLKTPAIFGFHGVYRVLAERLGIEREGQLGERGYELLNVWCREQSLDGFVGTGNGPGRKLRDQLRDALRDGLDQSAVARTNGWSGWRFFADHLAPRQPGRRERKFLANLLLDDPEGFRQEVLRFLVSPKGYRVWRGEMDSGRWSERTFHEALRQRASPELRRLLLAIGAYEQFSRLMQDAFDACLHEMTRRRGYVSVTQLGGQEAVKQASRRAAAAVRQAEDRLDPFGLAATFNSLFGRLGEGGSSTQWVARLMSHHRTTQERKPPNGKLPWFEGDERGYVIRPIYRREDPAAGNSRYVHLFRTRPLWSFASDLRMFPR
jgi:hypothetical protein